MNRSMSLSLLSLAAWAACLSTSTALQAQELSAAGFLAGNWLETGAHGETQEMWTSPRGELMAAVNTARRGTRTSFEFLRIERRDGKLVYLASPGGRMPPTAFPLKEHGSGHLLFENPQHDFPSRIQYRLDGDTLVARIEGTLGGKDRSMEWRFRRQP